MEESLSVGESHLEMIGWPGMLGLILSICFSFTLCCVCSAEFTVCSFLFSLDCKIQTKIQPKRAPGSGEHGESGGSRGHLLEVLLNQIDTPKDLDSLNKQVKESQELQR